MPREYFFTSDMHIGGAGELQHCDFEVELIEFLKSLEQQKDAELIINGDAFGLWEFTTLEGREKLEALIEQQPKLFEQFKQTGSKISITIMPGNHDYELACYPRLSTVDTRDDPAGDPLQGRTPDPRPIQHTDAQDAGTDSGRPLPGGGPAGIRAGPVRGRLRVRSHPSRLPQGGGR